MAERHWPFPQVIYYSASRDDRHSTWPCLDIEFSLTNVIQFQRSINLVRRCTEDLSPLKKMRWDEMDFSQRCLCQWEQCEHDHRSTAVFVHLLGLQILLQAQWCTRFFFLDDDARLTLLFLLVQFECEILGWWMVLLRRRKIECESIDFGRESIQWTTRPTKTRNSPDNFSFEVRSNYLNNVHHLRSLLLSAVPVKALPLRNCKYRSRRLTLKFPCSNGRETSWSVSTALTVGLPVVNNCLCRGDVWVSWSKRRWFIIESITPWLCNSRMRLSRSIGPEFGCRWV